MTRKELQDYIYERHMNVADILRLAGFNKAYLHHFRPWENLPDARLQAILSAIDFKQKQIYASLAYIKQSREAREQARKEARKEAREKAREKARMMRQHAYPYKIDRLTQTFEVLNEFEYGLDDNLVNDSWKQHLMTND